MCELYYLPVDVHSLIFCAVLTYPVTMTLGASKVPGAPKGIAFNIVMLAWVDNSKLSAMSVDDDNPEWVSTPPRRRYVSRHCC